jgi:hypothetical protein
MNMTIARQWLGKHACNTHVANNTAEEVFSMMSAPRRFARQLSGNTLLQQLGQQEVFSTWSVPSLFVYTLVQRH